MAEPVRLTVSNTGYDNAGFSADGDDFKRSNSILKDGGSQRSKRSDQSSVRFQNKHATEQTPSGGFEPAPNGSSHSSLQQVGHDSVNIEMGKVGDGHVTKTLIGSMQNTSNDEGATQRETKSNGVPYLERSISESPRHILSESELEETTQRIREHFSQFMDRDQRISEDKFKTALGNKARSFFVNRFFTFLDKNKDGFIDMSELTRGVRQLLSGTTREKVDFVFTLYDLNNSGTIERSEMQNVLQLCVREAKLKLKDDEIQTLTNALYDEGDSNRDNVFTRDDLTKMLVKNPKTLDNLTYNASIWLQPQAKRASNGSCSKYWSARYITNNAKKIFFLALFWLTNAAVFFYNAWKYKDENGWIIFARGSANVVNFSSALVVLLPMRNSITFLRTTFLYRIFPLDHNISLHKLVGMTLFIFSCFHTIGQIGNCVRISDNSNMSLPTILFTRDADIGWIEGLAPVTGVVLVAVLVTMVIASRSIIRRQAHFEVFYWTHKLYFIYYIIGVIHARYFWRWMVGPVTIFLVDKVISYIRRARGTEVTSVCLLPSEVTQLNIKKPANFNYRPGDYVHIKIPAIASHEWHPFTISSPPEQKDTFSLHIRSAGNWTNSLREYLLNDVSNPEVRRATRISRRNRHSSVWNGPRTSIARKKIDSIKNRTANKDVDLKVYVDGPYGSPCRTIFEAEHAILVGSGIGATPFASILQSITHRFISGRVSCPECQHSWCPAPQGLVKLQKVDFIWINRDQTNFEWFIQLLSRIEREMAREAMLKDVITLHMYMTAAPSQYEINGVGLQMALDLVRDAKSADLLTGLAARTQGGRPDFDKLLGDIKKNSPCSKLKVFFCGNPALAKTIHHNCMKHSIDFSKEQF